ncbi:MAG TPA: VWA domain-containing protein [Pyrinomonadaceae bacterium]|jgi:Ca-activated chloride channel family protein
MRGKRIRRQRRLEVSGLALLLWALVLLWSTSGAQGQRRSTQQKPANSGPAPTLEQLGDAPPPLPTPTPKPTPTPLPPEDKAENYDVVRVTSNLVVVPVAVTDAVGQPVLGLSAKDFHLEEEGRAQEIAEVGSSEQVPLDIAILFDVSSSVSEKYKFQQEAAARFLKEVMKPVDRAAVFAIKDQPYLEQPLSPANVAASKLLTLPAAVLPTPTAFYDAVAGAAEYLAKNAPERHRRVILVISDGEDNFSNEIRDAAVAEAVALNKVKKEDRTKAEIEAEKAAIRASRRSTQQTLHRNALASVQQAVERGDVVFYSINPTGPSYRLNEISTRAQLGMQQLADRTGGTAFVPQTTQDLETVFRQIANELRAQYLLQYYSNDQSQNSGKFLRIKVSVPSTANLRIRARQGYYSKK